MSSGAAQAPRGPLAGMRVLDFTLHAAGPFCTHLLTMLGAQCIKIETAARPDIFRKPHPVYGRMESATFDQVNAGKKSIRLNLKDPRGVELAKKLVAISDIVAESFRPGVMKRLGLDYDSLKAIKPDLVMVSVSAAGQSGPDSRHAGYAPLFGPGGGLGHLTGYRDGPPVEVRHVMDHSTGLAATAGVLAACYRKKRTGQGQHVDVAASDVAMSFIGDALLEAAFKGAAPSRKGNEMPGYAPHNVYPCKGDDQWVAIAVQTDAQWQALLEVVEQAHRWGSPERFASFQDRWNRREELDTLMARWTALQDRDDLVRRLQGVGVSAFASWSSEDVAASAHLNARGVVMELPGLKGRKVVGAPWRFHGTPAQLSGTTPALGEHTQEVFVGLLGHDEKSLQALIDEKVIW